MNIQFTRIFYEQKFALLNIDECYAYQFKYAQCETQLSCLPRDIVSFFSCKKFLRVYVTRIARFLACYREDSRSRWATEKFYAVACMGKFVKRDRSLVAAGEQRFEQSGPVR